MDPVTLAQREAIERREESKAKNDGIVLLQASQALVESARWVFGRSKDDPMTLPLSGQALYEVKCARDKLNAILVQHD